jgi:hypothetical protein
MRIGLQQEILNEREDLSHSDYVGFQQLTKAIVDSYRIRRAKP